MNAKFRKAAFIYRCIHNWSIDSQMYITRELTLSGSARFQILGKTWPTRDFRKLHTLTGEVEQLDLTWTLKGERCFLKFLNFHNATSYYKISENRSNDLCRPTGTPMITSELKGEVTGLCSGPRPKSISRRDFLAEHRIYFILGLSLSFEFLWVNASLLWALILMSQCFASLKAYFLRNIRVPLNSTFLWHGRQRLSRVQVYGYKIWRHNDWMVKLRSINNWHLWLELAR